MSDDRQADGYPAPRFAVDAFAGTADYYARYRPPYPTALVRDLLGRARVTGRGRLLDLACGPGRVALALAGSFREVWANDLEPEMIEACRAEAARRGMSNLRWLAGRAEALGLPDGAFALVTIGAAFHRLDQPVVAARVHRWLEPGGGIATLGCYEIPSGPEPWQQVVRAVVEKWRVRATGGPSEAGAPRPAMGPEHDEHVLREAGFEDVASHPFRQLHEWTVDAIVGVLYSMSYCSRRALGESAAAFEADLRRALRAHDPSGRFCTEMRFGYTFGRKPAQGTGRRTGSD